MKTRTASQEQAAALEERLIDFAARMIPLANRLGRDVGARHIANQVVRAGTAADPHYAEGRSAESRADFIHKLRLGLKELNETGIWLRIIAKTELLKPALLQDLIRECYELQDIFGASLRTARRS
jgi:four helix bundle protein